MPISPNFFRRLLAVASIAFTLLIPYGPASAGLLHLRNTPLQAPAADGQSNTKLDPSTLDQCRPVGHGTPFLQGEVSLTDQSTLVGHRIDDLLDAALAKDPGTPVVNKAISHFHSIPSRLFAQAKESLNFAVPYKGFGPSSEAGDIITGEKLKLKSRASADYARQKQIDDLHGKLVTSVMQIASGLGMSDKVRGREIVDTERNTLKDLVGDDEADKTVRDLTAWSKTIHVAGSVYKQATWDVEQSKSKYKDVFSNGLASDPVVQEVVRQVHKYNHRSKFARASGHAVETVLGVVALGPDFIGAGGRVALGLFVQATGGPEMEKVLKELYLDKRFESRYDVLSEETHQALDSYKTALLTHNAVLLACSESILQEIAGVEASTKVLGPSVLAPQAALTKAMAPRPRS